MDRKTHNQVSALLGRLEAFMLFLTFIVLKLTEVIDWSWWWVFAPVIAYPSFMLLIIILKVVIKGLSR